jgi:anti-sigma regulatory factor (Ser/Thr protein kinase)
VNNSKVATAVHAQLKQPVQQLLRSWHRVFPGGADQVREARWFLARCLAGSSTVDDAVTCLSELAANAVLHSNSRLPGGSFTVHARRDAAGRLRIEVVDQGGPWSCKADPSGQHGRGLLIVAQLAADSGIGGDLNGRVAWFELDGQ